MKLKIYFLVIVLGLHFISFAQTKLKFVNNNQIGLLSGSGNALQLQTINGISYKTSFLGIGTGIDNYYFKTIPLFIDVRKNIFSKKQTPFFYADAGTNFPVKTRASTTGQLTTYQPGLYYDFGFGYKWLIAKQLFVNASFGFSEKRYHSHEEFHYIGVDPGVPPDGYHYYLQRFSMKLGLGF